MVASAASCHKAPPGLAETKAEEEQAEEDERSLLRGRAAEAVAEAEAAAVSPQGRRK